MTLGEFIAWAMQRRGGERYELVGGEPVAISSERSGHALIKARVWRALDAFKLGARARLHRLS